MANLEDYRDKEFFTVENGEIEFHGYFYNECGWHLYDYDGSFRLPIKDFIEKYGKNYSEAYEDIAVSGTHYILAEDDYPDALRDIQNKLNECVKGAVPFDFVNITENMPDGYYVTT